MGSRERAMKFFSELPSTPFFFHFSFSSFFCPSSSQFLGPPKNHTAMLSNACSRSAGCSSKPADRNQRASRKSTRSLCSSSSVSASMIEATTTTTTTAPLSSWRPPPPLSLRPRSSVSTFAHPGARNPSFSIPVTTNARRKLPERGARAAPKRSIVAPAASNAAGASSPQPRLTQTAEASRYCYEDLVLFLLAVDCDVQLNRALTKEEYELAAAVRERRAQIDEALEALRAARDLLPTRGGGGGGGSGGGGASSSASASSSSDQMDAALEGVRLRSELATAIEAEE